ncbi:MAG: hypothetical protein JST63_19955 [Bacteroidetes bacterium]|nr:hypothetical protein [Bacteroidota bacterium]
MRITCLFILCLVVLSFLASHIRAQDTTGLFKYIHLLPASEGARNHYIEISSDVDSTWWRWQDRGYNFGFNKKLTPMYTTINGILSTPYMIQVRGNEDERNRKRWGFHVFEGYARDDKSRITMLVNKHVEELKPVAELYYYGTVYNHSNDAYNWFRIGSDVRRHSYMFSRDKAIFYGSLRLTNALTLGSVGAEDIVKDEPKKDAETNFDQDAKYINYRELAQGGDGTIFYDKDRDIVVIKIKGKWMKVAVEELPDDVKYPF